MNMFRSDKIIGPNVFNVFLFKYLVQYLYMMDLRTGQNFFIGSGKLPEGKTAYFLLKPKFGLSTL